MIEQIDHIGIAVSSLEQALPFWAEALGLDPRGFETVAAEKVKVAFLRAGASRIELLEATEPDSPVAKFIARRGAGIHHLTLAVRDLPVLLEQLGRRNIPVLGGGSRRGAGGREVAFLHPSATGGVLIELLATEDGMDSQPNDLAPGSPVLLYLHNPQEKLWGVLRRLDTTGVVVEGIELGSFDDWVGQIERGEQSVVGPSVLFVPMSRLEKIMLDRASGDLPSLAERFQRRTGRTVQDVLGQG